jgi:F-type H+-transporting ATPase subunit gamma
MSKLSTIQSKMRALRDIDNILRAMKNLSLVEITKISRFYAVQQELLQSVERALADFQQFYGAPVTEPAAGDLLYILIGSERGFCGGFNEAIERKLSEEASAGASVHVILVGRKLVLKFAEDKRVVASLDGPNTAEEIPSVLSHLAAALAGQPRSVWKIIHNVYSNGGSSVALTYPFEFSRPKGPSAFPFAPLLNVPPAELRPQLFEQYLFAMFYGILYLSFLAENHERLRHMDGALNALGEEEQRLQRLSNSLRQETITEELEIIMLNIGNSEKPSPA